MHHVTRRILPGALLTVLLAAPVQAAQWITSWAASPLPVAAAPGPGPAPLSLNNQTVRQVLHLSAGGSQLRIRLTNEYGSKPLKVGAATVARLNADGSIDRNSLRLLRFAGETSAIVPAAAPLLSDPVDLPVAALSDLSLSLYFPEDTGPCTCHQVGSQEGFVSEAGDFTAGEFTPKQVIPSRAFISGVDVQVKQGKTIVVLGDSISDGVGSTRNTNRRWPDVLARRLNSGRNGSWGVANHGISGNRVLEDGAGQSALARLDRDVLSVPGVTHLVVFEGVNDLGISFGTAGRAKPLNIATSARLIAGYRQIIARAQARGVKVIGATIAPYEGASYWSPEGEAQRQAINQWIRQGGEFDGVLDFDAVLRDPEHPSRIADGLHMGDHLHGSDAGYEAVGQSINLKLFR